MSESNKWFRDKWNRFDNWFDVFNENVENEILRKRLEIDRKLNGKNRKSK